MSLCSVLCVGVPRPLNTRVVLDAPSLPAELPPPGQLTAQAKENRDRACFLSLSLSLSLPCLCPLSCVVPVSERKSGLISVDDGTRTPQTFAAALRKAFKASVTRPASTHLAVAFPLISRDLSPFVAGITLQPVHIRPACVAIEVFRWRAKVIFVVCARKVKIGFARHVQAAERRSILHARRAPRELRPCNGFTNHLVHRTLSIIVYFR